MKNINFIIRYLFIALFLFSIMEGDNIISQTINNFQSNLTMYFVSLFIEPNNIKGMSIIINPHYRVIITDECNGLYPILTLYSAIIAYSSKPLYKLKWLIYSYIWYTIINILRILIVVFIAFDYGQESFFWSHDIFGNFLLISFGLISFIIYIKNIKV